MDDSDSALFAHWNLQRAHPAYQGWTWNGAVFDDAARKGLVLRRIEWWREAVELQHDRLTATDNRHSISDLNFFVLAVDNLVDAVKVIRKQYQNLRAVLSGVDGAVNRFEAACPDVGILRDLVEHMPTTTWLAISRSPANCRCSEWGKSRTIHYFKGTLRW
jgi:hypothetical protein